MEMTPQQARAKADFNLIQRIRTNESTDEDFRRLYDRYAPATFAFFVRKVGNPDLAADLNQELFLRLSKSIATFEGRCSWRTWVFLIARTTLAEERSQRWSHLADRSIHLDARALSESLKLDVDADDEAAAVFLRERLRICIKRLNDTARAVVVGHYYEGVTLRELTERLALDNASGSHSLLIGAQRKLRRCLTEWRAS